MKNKTRYIVVLIMGLITSFSLYEYIKRVNFAYTNNGTYFSPENGIVYKEQTKEMYAIIASLGLIFTVIFLYRLIQNERKKS